MFDELFYFFYGNWVLWESRLYYIKKILLRIALPNIKESNVFLYLKTPCDVFT